MTNSKRLMVALFIGLIGAVSPVAAHHSFAMFDQKKTMIFDVATVEEFNWMNPHTFVVLMAKGPDGSAKYTLECSSTNVMSHMGWKFTSLKPGDKVKVTFYPLRTGAPGGMLKAITLPNGKTMSAW